MALHLGLDVQSHPELLWIAGEAYDAPLPEYWTEHFDEEGNVYFFNQSTDDVSRDHPLDDYYRELYRLFRETPGLPEAEARRAAAGVLQRKGVAAAGPGPGGDGAAGGGVAPTQDQFNHSIHGAVSELREALSLSEKQRGETEAKLLEMATALQQSQNADAKIQQAAKEAAMDVLKQRLDAAEKAATEAKAAVEGERMKNELLLMETQYQGQIKDLEAKLSRAMSSRAEAKLAYKEEKKKAELVMKRAMETVAAAGASASSSESKRISELQQQLMAKEIELAEAVSALEVEKERAKLQLKHHRDLDAVLGEVKEGTTTVQEKLDGLQSNVAQQAKLEVDAQAVRAAEAAAAAREGALRDEIAALQGRLAGARGEGEARFAQREQELADEVARQKDRARKVELQHETELLRLRQRSHLDAASLARLRAAGDELRSVREFARTVARDAQQLRAVSADQLGQAAAVVARLNAEAAREAGKQRELADAIAACAQQMAPLIAEKRKLFNEMMRLKGNIRVFCRVRPMSQRELEAGGVEAVAFPTDCGQRMIELSSRLDHAVKKTYEYDRVFNGGATQEEVFEDVQPLIQSVMDGLNVCVFAYGQTGSGKTHTMEGYDGNRGVTYRSFEELFKLAGQTSGVYAYTFRVNMIEIYNETIVDLFMRKGTDSVKHDVKVEADGSVHIAGLSDREVRTPDEFVKVLLSGSRNRSVGATKMNDRSSRSHLVMMIKVAMRDRATDRVTHSKLSLVDLAGSERLKKSEVEGERLKESLNINKSLSALGDVIASLTSSKGHVPYRNSKLTHVLADSLGNDCKTLLFVNCSPAMENAQESGCSLMFASRARNVDLSSNGNTAASKKWKEAAALAEKVSKDKKRELEAVQEGLEEAQDKIAELQAAKKALKSDMISTSSRTRTRPRTAAGTGRAEAGAPGGEGKGQQRGRVPGSHGTVRRRGGRRRGGGPVREPPAPGGGRPGRRRGAAAAGLPAAGELPPAGAAEGGAEPADQQAHGQVLRQVRVVRRQAAELG